MSIRSMRMRAGISSQRSNPWRLNSLREPAVVGSQFGPRSGPPIYSSNSPSSAMPSWWPNTLASGVSPNGSCSTPGPGGRGPWTVTLKNREVPRLPFSR
jgi:hypothetical protein